MQDVRALSDCFLVFNLPPFYYAYAILFWFVRASVQHPILVKAMKDLILIFLDKKNTFRWSKVMVTANL